MNFLLDANVAYFLLVSGLTAAILALFTPGTGFLEIGAVFVLILAGYSISTMDINWWALVILTAGIFPFLLALRHSRHYRYLLVSLLALVCGSIFLIRGDHGLIAINPWLALITSSLALGFLWFAGTKSMEAISKTPLQDLERLIGLTGTAVTDIYREGSVHVGGEEWTAHSDRKIPAGSPVLVTKRNGLVLEVTALPQVDTGLKSE